MVAYLSQRILERFQYHTCQRNLVRYMSSPASLPCLFSPWALYVMLDVLMSLLPLPWKLNYATTWYCKATTHHPVYGFFSCRRMICLSFQTTIQCYTDEFSYWCPKGGRTCCVLTRDIVFTCNFYLGTGSQAWIHSKLPRSHRQDTTTPSAPFRRYC
jgi:hypothetical protein